MFNHTATSSVCRCKQLFSHGLCIWLPRGHIELIRADLANLGLVFFYAPDYCYLVYATFGNDVNHTAAG